MQQLHCPLHTEHCTLNAAHCTLHTAHWALHTAHNIFRRKNYHSTAHWTVHIELIPSQHSKYSLKLLSLLLTNFRNLSFTAHWNLYTELWKLHTAQCTLYTEHWLLYNAPHTLNNTHFTLWTAQHTLHTWNDTVHTAHRTLHTAHCIFALPIINQSKTYFFSFLHLCNRRVNWGRPNEVFWQIYKISRQNFTF